MSREWIVKKSYPWIRVVVYSAVGMAILISMMTIAALSGAK
jgi:hypothetical protein